MTEHTTPATMNPHTRAIIDSGKRLVISITGGGLGALVELTRYGEASAVLVHANTPYAEAATVSLLGGKPDKFASEATARALAVAAFEQGVALGENPHSLVGIGVTCSLRAKIERPGRTHRVCFAAQTDSVTISGEIKLDGTRSRVEEEAQVAAALLNLIHQCVEYTGEFKKPSALWHSDTMHMDILDPPDIIKEVFAGLCDYAISVPGIMPPESPQFEVVYPGAFNPMHDKHLEIMRVAAEWTGKPVYLELTMKSAHKPALDYMSWNERYLGIRQQLGAPVDSKVFGGILTTRAATFVEKSFLYPNCTFVIGYDNVLKLCDPKFYPWSSVDEAAAILQANGAHFLAFHRQNIDIDFATLPESMRQLITVIPSSMFEDDGTSSTQLRTASA
jgi:hypothetical protein